MPKRLVVYKKICNIKILAPVNLSPVVQLKTDRKDFGPARHWRGKRLGLGLGLRFDKCRAETTSQQFKSKLHRNTTEMVLFQ